jgi:hypothetical protein
MRLVVNLPALVMSTLLLLSATPLPACAQEDPPPPYSSLPILAKKVADSAWSPDTSTSLRLSRSGGTSARVYPAVGAYTTSTNRASWLIGQAAPAPQSDKPEAPRLRDFGHALAPNFTTGLFSPKNLKPLAIGSMATLAFLPLDQKIGDSTRGHFVEFGKSGSISSHHY